MIEIRRIHYLDHEAKEAELEISSGKSSFLVFCHPYEHVHVPAKVFLYALFADDIQAVSQLEPPQKLNNGYFSYQITGTVIDTARQIVQVDEFSIILDTPIPRDIPNGSLVSFSVQRLDYLS